MGKGSRPRPRSITREEMDLRGDYARGRISLTVFNLAYRRLKRAGLIKRNGKVL